jgi:hypothetical protein
MLPALLGICPRLLFSFRDMVHPSSRVLGAIPRGVVRSNTGIIEGFGTAKRVPILIPINNCLHSILGSTNYIRAEHSGSRSEIACAS